MRDGIYTPFGLRELPEANEQTGGYQSSMRPRSIGAFLSLGCMMLWMTLSGFSRGLRRKACTD
ncbi:hypothetical protein LJC49_08330 [Ruminococcaceae bacterium OttesenSCG-928-I18]|nr:hypothetical protein [Ruminococcaceae bacterium OttesenSCG-928-I18]